MPSRRYTTLSKQLIDAGVASKYVARLREELADHCNDLEAEGRAADKAPGEARREARNRIGDEQTIVAEFQNHPELKAWVYRSRIAFCAIKLAAIVLLGTIKMLDALAQRRSGLYRLATAASAALIVVATMLLSLGLLTSKSWTPIVPQSAQDAPDRVTDDTFAGNRPTVPVKPPPIFITLPDPIEEYAAELRAVAWSTDVSIETRPFAISFPRLTDGEYLPIVKVAPAYPIMAAVQGIEGYVVVEFTVTRSGAVQDVVVIESSDDLFEEAAIQAAYKFKYKPRIIDGEAVDVTGVRNRISFKFQA